MAEENDAIEQTAGGLRGVPADVILAPYLSGASIDDIAAKYGVSQQALSRYLLRHAPDDWQSCQVARQMTRKEQAQQDFDDLRNRGYYVDETGAKVTGNKVVLACARERLRAAQWDLERTLRRIYGDHIEIAGDPDAPLISMDPGMLLIETARNMLFIMHQAQQSEVTSEVTALIEHQVNDAST